MKKQPVQAEEYNSMLKAGSSVIYGLI